MPHLETIQDPVVIIAFVAALIVLAPLLLARWRVPGMVVILLAGAVFGPNGLGLLARDKAIELLGTVGLLFIMFTAALEVDMVVLKRSRVRTSVFGAFTFAIPMAVGLVSGRFVLGFDWPAAVLFASLLASHTLLAYPIVARLGLTNNPAVSTALGGTILTDTAALLVLAIVVASDSGELDGAFWARLGLSITAYVACVLVLIPRLARWFFRVVRPDGTSEFAFVLAVIFGVASLSHAAGVEPIVGAFLAGLALNSSIPHGSPLMNRITFTGDAIFVPFFLLSVGMLLDVRVFGAGWHSWSVALTMVVAVTAAKYLAALVTGRIFGFHRDETGVLFGLSLAQAAATLAAVLVGFDIGLFDEAVLNGAIVMMLVTCVGAPWLVDRHGRRLAAARPAEAAATSHGPQRILVALSHAPLAEPLSELALLLRDPGQRQPVVPATVVLDSPQAAAAVADAEKTLARAVAHLTAADVPAEPVTRVDLNVAGALRSLRAAHHATDVVLGWTERTTAQHRLSGSFLDHLLQDEPDYTLWVARVVQPLSTTARVHFAVPPLALLEPGFARTAGAVKHMAHGAGASLVLWADAAEASRVQTAVAALAPAVDFAVRPVDAFTRAAEAIAAEASRDDLVVVYGAREGGLAWNPKLRRLPFHVAALLPNANLIAVYAAATAAHEHAPAPLAAGGGFLTAAGVVADLPGRTLEEALPALLARVPGLSAADAEGLVPALVESAQPLDPGLLLLHGYAPTPERSKVLLGRSLAGLSLADPGAPAAHLVFVIVHPADHDPQKHLDLLARLVRRVHGHGLLASGLAAGSAEALAALFADAPEPAAPPPALPPPGPTRAPSLPAPARAPELREAALTLPEDEALAQAVHAIHADLGRAAALLHQETCAQLQNASRELAGELERLLLRALGRMERARAALPESRGRALLDAVAQQLVGDVARLLKTFEEAHTASQREAVLIGLSAFSEGLVEAVEHADAERLVATPRDDRPGRRPRLRRVLVRAHLAGLLDHLAPSAVDAALERLVDGRLRSLLGLADLAHHGLAVALRLAADSDPAMGPGPAPTRPEGAPGPTLLARVAAWRTAEAAIAERDALALASFASDVAQSVSDLLRDPTQKRRRRTRRDPLPPFDPAVVADRHAPALDRLTLVATRAHLEARLEAFHLRVRAIGRTTRDAVEASVERGILAELATLRAGLEAYAATSGEAASLAFVVPGLAARFDDREVTATLLEALEQAGALLPESVRLFSEEGFRALRERRPDAGPLITVAVRRLATFALQTDLVAALQPTLARLAQAAEEASSVARDVHRLVSIEHDPAAALDRLGERVEAAREGIERLEAAAAAVRDAAAALPGALESCAAAVVQRTAVDRIAQPTGRFARFVTTEAPRHLGARLSGAGLAARDAFRRRVVGLTYVWSRNVARARSGAPAAGTGTSRIEDLLELRRRSAPRPEVEARLPIVYRQIFTGRPGLDPAYWLGMEGEVRRAREALEAHAAGRPGAVLVTGPVGAGRTALLTRVSGELFDRAATFHVHPPEVGSIDPADLDAALSAALHSQVPVDQALASLPAGSAVVLHDLELWWERSAAGHAVLERLSGLIEAHGGHCVFLLEGAEPFVRLATRLTDLGDQLLATLVVRPIDAYQLREAVLRRHEATGLKLRLEGDSGDPSEWKLARVFSSLSAYSGGYAGPALDAWLGHVRAVDGDTIVVGRPRPPDLRAFDTLAPEWTALLAQLLLHKRLTLDRLERLTGQDRATLRTGLAALRRSGLVHERPGTGAHEVDRAVQHHLVRWLDAREVL